MTTDNVPFREREDVRSLLDRIDQQYVFLHGEDLHPTPFKHGVVADSDRSAFNDNKKSLYDSLKFWPLDELSAVLIVCGVDETWAFRHVGTMREVLRYNVRFFDDDWSLYTVDSEIYHSDYGFTPEDDALLEEMGYYDLDHVCRNIAEGYEWDAFLKPQKSPSTHVVTVEADVDDVNSFDPDEIPF